MSGDGAAFDMAWASGKNCYFNASPQADREQKTVSPSERYQIEVTASAQYVAEQSRPEDDHYVFAYHITIRNNQVRGHRDGIYFEFVTNSLIVGNHSEGNMRYGLHFMFSHNDEYRDNTFVNNGAGVAVMYLGRIVEHGPAEQVLKNPRHPYTKALLAAVPRVALDATPAPIAAGDPPSPAAPPAGCHYHPRCALADARCRASYPTATSLDGGHQVACHHSI